MRIRNFAPAAAAVLALGTSAAFATTVTYDVTGSYSISGMADGTTVSNELGTYHDHVYNFSASGLSLGTESSPTHFFQVNPPGSCNGCSGGLLTDTLTIAFGNLAVTNSAHQAIGNIPSLTLSGVFDAQYDSWELPCAMGDGSSPSYGDTDCFIWQQDAHDDNNGKYNGYSEFTDSLGGGYDLNLFLYNAADWDITPKIGFEVTRTPVTTPEPATLALFAAGLAALAVASRRRRPG